MKTKTTIGERATVDTYIGQSNPVRAYLESLRWYGTYDVGVLALDAAFGHASRIPKTAAALRQFFDDAVRRAYEPGCQVDRTFVLVGSAGTGKSNFLRMLGGKFAAQLDGEWLREVPFNIQVQVTKEYLTAVEDVFHYGRRVERYPRTYYSRPTTSVLRLEIHGGLMSACCTTLCRSHRGRSTNSGPRPSRGISLRSGIGASNSVNFQLCDAPMVTCAARRHPALASRGVVRGVEEALTGTVDRRSVLPAR